jgi:hypothetical protein
VIPTGLLLRLGGLLAILLALLAYHWHATSAAFSAGKAEVQVRWDAEKDIQRGALEAERGARARERKESTQRIIALAKESQDAIESLQTRLASSDAAVSRLRNSAVGAGPARVAVPDGASAATLDLAKRLGECRSMVWEGIQLAAEGGGLVAEGEGTLGQTVIQLTALQRYVREEVRPDAPAR